MQLRPHCSICTAVLYHNCVIRQFRLQYHEYTHGAVTVCAPVDIMYMYNNRKHYNDVSDVAKQAMTKL